MIAIFDVAVYEWGLEVIRTVQSIKSDVLTFFMLFISFLSDSLAYLCFLPILFWCIDEKKGLKVGLLVLFSASINTSIKDFLQVPRPYVQDPSVGLTTGPSFSTPSGHSQNSAAFWPFFASLFTFSKKQKKNILLKASLAIGMPLLIGFTRVYLGVHYPSDVLLGWTLGFLFSLGAILFTPFIEKIATQIPKAFKILLVGITAFLLNWIGPHDTSMSAAFFGLGIGYIYLAETGGYNAKKGSPKQKILRILIGLTVVAMLYGGLKIVFPSEGESSYQLFRFIRYLLVGFSASFALPKLFIALKIAFPREKNDNE